MSNSNTSRVGAGAAARKRDRYTSRMNDVHPPRLGRAAMDAKYLNDPLYDRVMSLSYHLSEQYGDYTVNETRTLVSLAAEDPTDPRLQRYWDEIDGVIPAEASDAELVSAFEVGAGTSQLDVAHSQSECSSISSETVEFFDVSVDIHEIGHNQVSEAGGSVPQFSVEHAALGGDETETELLTSIEVSQLTTSKVVNLDINRDDSAMEPIAPPRRKRNRAVEPVELDLLGPSITESAVWNTIMDPVHVMPSVEESCLSGLPQYGGTMMLGRKRNVAENHSMVQSYVGVVRSFLFRETRCSMLSLRVAVCLAGFTFACVIGAAASL